MRITRILGESLWWLAAAALTAGGIALSRVDCDPEEIPAAADVYPGAATGARLPPEFGGDDVRVVGCPHVGGPPSPNCVYCYVTRRDELEGR